MRLFTAIIAFLWAASAYAQSPTQVLWGNQAGSPPSIVFKSGSSWIPIGTYNGGVFSPTLPITTLGITRTQIPTTSIPTAYQTFTTAGYATTFDGGEGCEWTRATSSAPGAVQSADGAYWALSRTSAIDIKCVGGLTTSSDIYGALIAASNIAKDAGGFWGQILLSGKYPGGTTGYTLATSGAALAPNQSISGCAASRAFLNYSPTSGTALEIDGGSNQIECLYLQANNSTNTAVGLQLGKADGSDSGAQGRYVSNLDILGFNIGINAISGNGNEISNVIVNNYGQYGIAISNPSSPDGGNWRLINFQASPKPGFPVNAAGIKWVSSNGGTILGGTTFSGEFGLDFNLSADSPAGGNINIVANLMGQATVSALNFSTSGTGQSGTINIVGNNLDALNADSIVFNSNAVADAVVVGNSCGPAHSGPPMKIWPGNNFITIGPNNCFFPWGFADYRVSYEEGGDVHREQTYPHITSSDSVGWKSAWSVQVGRDGGGKVEVVSEGTVTTDGSFVRRDTFDVRYTGGTLVCLSESSYTTGAAVGVNCDVSTTPGTAYIQYRTSSSGTTLNGTMSVRTMGHISRLDAVL